MHKGLFLTALATMLTLGSTALAEREGGDSRRGMDIKREVLHGVRHGGGAERVSRGDVQRPQREALGDRVRPRGDMVDRPGARSSSAASRGKNISASSSVNTPSEVRAMQKLINPMHGAYRMAAGGGTDSYGKAGSLPMTYRTADGKVVNLSASAATNTPKEIRSMLKMINPMKSGGFVAAAGTDSYGGKSLIPQAYGRGANGQRASATTQHGHFVDAKGEVISTTKGNSAYAMKNRHLRDMLMGKLQSKMAQKARMAGR
jgi:hypothetical protein